MTLVTVIQERYYQLAMWLERLFEPFALLAIRLLVAQVFLLSGLSKWTGFLQFDVNKYELFLYEFFCPDPIRPGALLLCNPDTLEYTEGSFGVWLAETMAVMAGVVEVVLPILLILGLFSRFAAFGLLGMTLFIQFAVYPDWSHFWNPAAWWAGVLFLIVAKGPGLISLDRWLRLERKAS
ncbi:DoxX family protein [Aliidiomarina sp.]|uniref:DoxX family protein n=1 Tax=Aliidiomarina sp. TaxID=1872439 RepID=UPI003A4DC369